MLDAANGERKGYVGEEERLEQWVLHLDAGEDTTLNVTFDWDVKKQGLPGAVIVKNYHSAQFFLKTITIDDVPGHGRIVFVANSWVYNTDKYKYDRVFFTNQVQPRTQTCLSLTPNYPHLLD
jgi:linoleate 9S-lipoxygenase